ncbi:MAG: Hsp20 family protein [Hyphomicrobiaceae bacterium]|nr:Hsp20 family protein [Hyphomicrobiaceae bacterium]
MQHHITNSLYHSTVGFDRLFKLLDNVTLGGSDATVTYPPYNIEQRSEHEYRISMAVAGFSDEELSVDVKEQMLTVNGDKRADKEEVQYVYRGIAQRGFKRKFQLADHVEVKSAKLADGLLHIDLKRNLPDNLKPRTIKIITESSAKTELIEA